MTGDFDFGVANVDLALTGLGNSSFVPVYACLGRLLERAGTPHGVPGIADTASAFPVCVAACSRLERVVESSGH